jgi:hypothetical protein
MIAIFLFRPLEYWGRFPLGKWPQHQRFYSWWVNQYRQPVLFSISSSVQEELSAPNNSQFRSHGHSTLPPLSFPFQPILRLEIAVQDWNVFRLFLIAILFKATKLSVQMTIVNSFGLTISHNSLEFQITQHYYLYFAALFHAPNLSFSVKQDYQWCIDTSHYVEVESSR